MFGSDEDGLATDTVHIDTCTGFEVVEVDKAIFRNKIDDAVGFGNLHGNGEVVCSFGWEVDIDGLFDKGWIGVLVVDFDDM